MRMRRSSTVLWIACTFGSAAGASAQASPHEDCDLALASAAALADRFGRGDPSLGAQDAADLAWITLPEYRQTLEIRGCAAMAPQFESVAMAGLRSSRMDVRALLRQACAAGTEPLADPGAQAAREAMREQGLAGLKALGDDASACLAPAGSGMPAAPAMPARPAAPAAPAGAR
jgi:hypothetical protein